MSSDRLSLISQQTTKPSTHLVPHSRKLASVLQWALLPLILTLSASANLIYRLTMDYQIYTLAQFGGQRIKPKPYDPIHVLAQIGGQPIRMLLLFLGFIGG
ncbi:hypothetical protein XENOCAPTIV_007800 [Xenoophorus captivus]|uniref:Uncharacterized protein n=1 Tax=Xenoophorus captivus TaxID=1517983 RepID=A0ABV0S7N5_9TELE